MLVYDFVMLVKDPHPKLETSLIDDYIRHNLTRNDKQYIKDPSVDCVLHDVVMCIECFQKVIN